MQNLFIKKKRSRFFSKILKICKRIKKKTFEKYQTFEPKDSDQTIYTQRKNNDFEREKSTKGEIN